MDLLIVRHGQSEADLLHVIEGRADFSLTELGFSQAARMADWVKNYMSIDKIVASPLTRARQTAEKLSAATGVPVELDDCLMEWKNGLIAGLTPEEANKRYPPPEKKHLHTALYGQESMMEFRARAETALSRVLSENPPDAKIALVSHGGMISMLFRSFLELPNTSRVSVASGSTGIHHWSAEHGGSVRRVVFMNSRVHLD